MKPDRSCAHRSFGLQKGSDNGHDKMGDNERSRKSTRDQRDVLRRRMQRNDQKSESNS
jgi:hypothetical protein